MMRELVRGLLVVVAWGMGPAGCKFPALPPLGGDASMGAGDASVDVTVDAPPPMFLSCLGLGATCGPSGSDSCCTSLLVTGGAYYRSYDAAGDTNSGNTSSPATVSDFRLDKYEVTVGRFRAFVNAGRGTQAGPPAIGDGAHTNIPGSGWDLSWNTSLAVDKAALLAGVKCDSLFQTWTDSPEANEARPMNCITWWEALAFCAWDGGFLPTEPEWNYAATGGDQQRAYPWSNPAGALAVDGAHASYFDGANCVGDGMPGCAVTDLVQVGSKSAGDGRWGQSDLAGNVMEWNLDRYESPYGTPCNNCAVLSGGLSRVVRGGSFDSSDATYLRAGNRYSFTPAVRFIDFGVRCARTQ